MLWSGRSAPATPRSSSTRAGSSRCIAPATAARSRGRGRPKKPSIALDAATGKTLWEHKYPSRREDFSFGAGPHSTPLIVGDRLFTIGTNKQLFAFDKKTGKVLWSHDFIKEFNSPELLIRPVVKTGYGCSPIAYRDTIICSVGGPGQSVMAFRQSDGAVVWKSGDFLTSEAPPILIAMGGREQLVVFGGGTVNGMDPANGRDPVVAPARSRQRSQLRDAALRARQHPVRVVGVSRRQPRDPADAGRRRDARRGAVVHQPRALHVPQRDPASAISSTARPATSVRRS